MIKQFIRTLKSIAFDWYTDLGLESIDSWGQIEKSFWIGSIVPSVPLAWLSWPTSNNGRMSWCWTISTADLRLASSARTGYLKLLLWRCAPKIWYGPCSMFYKWANLEPFQEFETKVQDMKVNIANLRGSSFSVAEWKNDRVEFKKNVKFFTSSTKEAMTISKVEPVGITWRPNLEENRSAPFKDMIRRRPTLKELQKKKYMFPDLHFPGMVDDLLEKGVI